MPLVITTLPTETVNLLFQIPGNTAPDNRQVILIVPPLATSTQTIWTVAPTVSLNDVSSGYATVIIQAKVATPPSSDGVTGGPDSGLPGSAITKFAVPIQININRPASDGVPASSIDNGLTWQPMTLITGSTLPANLNDGYAIGADGSIIIYTRHLSLMGIRKPTPTVDLASATNFLQLGESAALTVTGGAGSGDVKYVSQTPKICSVAPTGFVVGLAAGNCLVTATKYASEIFLDTTSNAFKFTISDSDAKAKAAALAKLAASKISVGTTVNGVTPIRIKMGAKFVRKLVKVSLRSTFKGKTATAEIGRLTLDAKGSGTLKTKVKIPKGGVLTVVLAPKKALPTKV